MEREKCVPHLWELYTYLFEQLWLQKSVNINQEVSQLVWISMLHCVNCILFCFKSFCFQASCFILVSFQCCNSSWIFHMTLCNPITYCKTRYARVYFKRKQTLFPFLKSLAPALGPKNSWHFATNVRNSYAAPARIMCHVIQHCFCQIGMGQLCWAPIKIIRIILQLG